MLRHDGVKRERGGGSKREGRRAGWRTALRTELRAE
jgi:hypothetical protein